VFNLGNRSKFPNGVDDFVELFDLPYDKMQNASRLTALKMKQTLDSDEQAELAILTRNLENYIITPETWNKFQDALQAVQRFFHSQVQGFLDEKHRIWEDYINQFSFVGNWSAGKSYKLHNLVFYNGDLYLCLKNNNSSTTPDRDATNWRKISQKGEKGDPGLQGILRGRWDSGRAYVTGDAVVYGLMDDEVPIVYIATQNNTNKNPSTNKDCWILYDKLFHGNQIPQNVASGAHVVLFT
jgi:hypothetical protein